ncbi:MAG: phosphoribosylglycinamide formyltransferase [Henriciella sp.]|nr:phosphoribosylglycinamide formyltransferase [Henriciella sp.]
MKKHRLAILISGRGSNMEAILSAATASDYPAEPKLVLSNRPDAAGLQIATKHRVQTACVDHKPFGSDREAFERQMDAILQEHQIEIIALAGFMRVLTPWFVRRWTGRMINIHPSLLPKYPGLNTHQRAIDAGDPEAGCSVHWVTEGVDEGAVIAQAKAPILPDDTVDSLAARILPLEHELYPRALAEACQSLK